MILYQHIDLTIWCHELKRTRSATSPDSRVINPGFLRVVVTPHPDTVKIGIITSDGGKNWIDVLAFFADMLDDGMGHDR
jgi:hypothetical protein